MDDILGICFDLLWFFFFLISLLQFDEFFYIKKLKLDFGLWTIYFFLCSMCNMCHARLWCTEWRTLRAWFVSAAKFWNGFLKFCFKPEVEKWKSGSEIFCQIKIVKFFWKFQNFQKPFSHRIESFWILEMIWINGKMSYLFFGIKFRLTGVDCQIS